MADRVLVCGGRNWQDRDTVWQALYAIPADCGDLILEIIEGGANGADRFARQWAEHCGVPVRTFYADWVKDGRAAGPIRNQRMIDDGKPDLVVAFPGGRGTADMVRRAKAAGIEVREIPTPEPARLQGEK